MKNVFIMDNKNEELNAGHLFVYGEDIYDHASPGLIYVDTSFPGFGVDLDYFNSKCKGCTCSSNCEAGLCQCLFASGIKSLSDMTLKYADRPYPIFECHTLCSCDTSCTNKLSQKGPRRGLCVASVGEKGLGVISRLDISAGSFICEYAGEIIGEEEAKRRLKLLRDSDSNYILFLREHIGFGTAEAKLETTIIDPTTVGNIGRYINHSCDPNMRVVPVRSESVIPIAALFAVKDIKIGEELCYDYNDSITKPEDGNVSKDVFHTTKPCLCFSSSCRKYLPLNYFV